MDSPWLKFLPGFIRNRIEGHHVLQEVLGNTGWMMGDQIVRKVVGLIVGVLLARYLGPGLFGELSYAFALVLIVSPIAMLSLDAITIRRLVQDPSSRDEVLGTSFMLMITGGLVAFCLAMASIFLVRPEDHIIHWLVGILTASIIVQAFIAIEFWFESQMQWKYTVYAKTSSFLILSIVKIGLILIKAPLVAFAWAGFTEIALGSIGLLLVYRFRGFSIKAWRFRWPTAASLLKDCWPLVSAAFLTMVYLRIDQVMLGSMIGSRELGNYSVAVQITEVWVFIPMVICSSVFPVIVECEARSEELFYERLHKLYSLMVLFSYIIAIPVTFFSKEIIHLLFSSAYTDAGPLLAILIWTGVFTSLERARQVLIVAKNWTRVNLVSIALGCALNVVLNIIMIPRYGAMGAVIATFISYWFAVHGTCFLFKSLRKTGLMMTKAMIFPKFW